MGGVTNMMKGQFWVGVDISNKKYSRSERKYL